MKKNAIIVLIFMFAVGIVVLNKNKSSQLLIQGFDIQSQNNTTKSSEKSELSEDLTLYPPLENAKDRVTKKPFGIFVTPQSSPVSPERFYGYHDATDFEIFPGEEDKDIEVKAICSGEILSKRSANGYGGVAIQACKLENNPITVVYGHLKLSSINKKIGESWERGEMIGILGRGYSNETDNERKHLHLGIHRGESINILGYVSSKEDLNNWIDPCLYLCKK